MNCKKRLILVSKRGIMKILILGLGLNGGGASAARYFAGKADVRISDISPRETFGPLADEMEALGINCHFSDKDPKENIKWADIVIKNPAIPNTLPQLSLAKNIQNDFSYLFSSPLIKDIKLILVTGTKGKSTTVSAITHALNRLGNSAIYCGNIGVSAFEILKDLENRQRDKKPLPNYIVAEMSSWQIHDTNIALNGVWPNTELTILTSLYRDHQNRYHSLTQYYDDKLTLINHKCKHILINIRTKLYVDKHTHGLKRKIKLFPTLFNPYAGNKIELMCAFNALKLLGFKKDEIIKALSSYKGIPHRIEQIAIKNDIMFINDSAATISEAVTFSTSTLYPLSYHLICGGTDKDIKALGMLPALKSATSILLLDGSFTTDKLIPLLNKYQLPYYGPYNNLRDAFEKAVDNAEEKKGFNNQMQVVILSPGAASFGMFKNEFDRGDSFRRLVGEYVSRA